MEQQLDLPTEAKAAISVPEERSSAEDISLKAFFPKGRAAKNAWARKPRPQVRPSCCALTMRFLVCI